MAKMANFIIHFVIVLGLGLTQAEDVTIGEFIIFFCITLYYTFSENIKYRVIFDLNAIKIAM